MKHETFLQLHDRLLKDGVTYAFWGDHFLSGLCGVDFNGKDLKYNKLFALIIPDGDKGYSYWASGRDGDDARGEYTELRQNIILLLAALNGEL